MTYDKLIEKINRVNEQQERDMPSLPHCSNLLYQLNKKKKGKEDYCTELVNRYLATRDITYTPDDVASYVSVCLKRATRTKFTETGCYAASSNSIN